MSMTRKRSSTNTISKQDSFVMKKKKSTTSSGEPVLETLNMPLQKYISFGMDDDLAPPRFEIKFSDFTTPLRLNIGHGSPASLPHLREDRDMPKASGGFT